MKKRVMSEETKQMFRAKRAKAKAKTNHAKELVELQKRCDEWNEKHPIGTKVICQAWKPGGPKRETFTTSIAWVLGEHSPVVRLDKVGPYHLDFLEVLDH